MRPLKERVARGAIWLDDNVPGWSHRINLETLSFPSVNDCVLGQLDLWSAHRPTDLDAYGWNSLDDEDEAWETLTEEWRSQVLASRRADT